jgi:small-conductance mechanosensitive channel
MTAMAHLAQSDIGDVSDFVTSTKVTITDVVLALLVLIVTWVLARLARRGVGNVLGRLGGISADLRQLASRVTFYFLLLLGFGVALTFVGAEVQPLLTAAIILAIVAGLALRGIADNFASGVVIQTRHPIEIGDEVEILDQRGVVHEINGRSVVLHAWDGRRIHIPNREVLDNPLVNHSLRTPRRSDVEVRVASDASVEDAASFLRDVTAGVAGVLADPPPEVFVRAVEPRRLVVVVRFAHTQSETAAAVSRVVTDIGEAYRERGTEASVTAPPPVAPLTPPATV